MNSHSIFRFTFFDSFGVICLGLVEFLCTFYVVKVSLESLRNLSFCLAYILFAAGLAGNTVNQIGASACDIEFC
jgi:hypothetical protein